MDRGIRTLGVSPSRLREELEGWTDLHYTNKVFTLCETLNVSWDLIEVG